jgi:hypothetical protein
VPRGRLGDIRPFGLSWTCCFLVFRPFFGWKHGLGVDWGVILTVRGVDFGPSGGRFRSWGWIFVLGGSFSGWRPSQGRTILVLGPFGAIRRSLGYHLGLFWHKAWSSHNTVLMVLRVFQRAKGWPTGILEQGRGGTV